MNTTFSVSSSSVVSILCDTGMYFLGFDIDLPTLELEPRLAGGLRQGLHPTVEAVAAPVEHHHLDSLFQRPLGKETAHQAGHVLLGLALAGRRGLRLCGALLGLRPRGGLLAVR